MVVDDVGEGIGEDVVSEVRGEKGKVVEEEGGRRK